MHKMIGVVLLGIGITALTGLAQAQSQEPLTLPVLLADWPGKNGCKPVANFYDDETRMGQPFVMLFNQTAAMWCQDEKNGKYHLLVGKTGAIGFEQAKEGFPAPTDPCPLFVLRDLAELGGLSQIMRYTRGGDPERIDLAKAGYVAADGSPRQGGIFFSQIVNTVRGKRTAYVCFKGEWLHANLDAPIAPRPRK